MVAATLALLWAGTALAAGTPAQKCQSTKNKLVGKYAACRENAEAKLATTGDTTKYAAAITKCEDKYQTAWGKAETAGGCVATSDQTAVQGATDEFTDSVAQHLSTGAPLADCPTELAICNAGTAALGDVLSGKTFLSSAGLGVAGTMANIGAVTITPNTSTQTIAAGYHNGSGTVAGDANLVPGNIKSGTSIFGVAGNPPVVNTSGATATAGDMAAGKTAYANGSLVTGTVPAGSNVTGANGATSITIPDGLYTGSKTATATDTNLVAGNIKSGATVFGVSGSVIQASGNASTVDVLSGKTFSNASGPGTGSMPNNGAVTITPSTSAQPIAAGYHNGSGSVAGDPALVSSNIKNGASIFGVSGSVIQASGNASSGDVLFGQTFSNASGAGTGAWIALAVASSGRAVAQTPTPCGEECVDRSTYRQHSSNTIDRLFTATKYRVVAFGDSIYAGYLPSCSANDVEACQRVAKRSAPWVLGEYLSTLWNADIEVVRITWSGATAAKVYSDIQHSRLVANDSSTRVVTLEMCGNDYLQARDRFRCDAGCDSGVLEAALANCTDYMARAMDEINRDVPSDTYTLKVISNLYYPGYAGDGTITQDAFLKVLAQSNYRACSLAEGKDFKCVDSFAEYMGADYDTNFDGQVDSEALRYQSSSVETEDQYVDRIANRLRITIQDPSMHSVDATTNYDYMQSDDTHPSFFGSTIDIDNLDPGAPDFSDSSVPPISSDGKNPEWNHWGHERMGWALSRFAACGNGSLDFGETCDDGNIVSGDGCNSSLFTKSCG